MRTKLLFLPLLLVVGSCGCGMNRASTASATVSQAAPPSAAGSPSGAAVQASYQTPVNNTATESTSASSPPRQGEAQNVGRNLDNKNPAWHEPARGGYTD